MKQTVRIEFGKEIINIFKEVANNCRLNWDIQEFSHNNGSKVYKGTLSGFCNNLCSFAFKMGKGQYKIIFTDY